MFNYDPTFEEKSPRVMLIKLVGKRQEFGHIYVEFLREAVASYKNADTMQEHYADGPNATGYRRTSWSSNKKGAFMIEDLIVSSQMTGSRKDGDDPKPYAVEMIYRDTRSIDKSLVLKMADTMTRIDRKMTKLEQDFGYASGDLATYICRVAAVMGIKKFIVAKDDNIDGRLDNRHGYHEYKATEVAYVVDQMVKEYYESV